MSQKAKSTMWLVVGVCVGLAMASGIAYAAGLVLSGNGLAMNSAPLPAADTIYWEYDDEEEIIYQHYISGQSNGEFHLYTEYEEDGAYCGLLMDAEGENLRLYGYEGQSWISVDENIYIDADSDLHLSADDMNIDGGDDLYITADDVHTTSTNNTYITSGADVVITLGT